MIDTTALRNRLKLKSIVSEKRLRDKHPIAHRFFQNSGLRPGQIRDHAAKILASGALASTLMLSVPVPIPTIGAITDSPKIALNSIELTRANLVYDLKSILPQVGQWELSSEQEGKISERILKTYGVNATAKLDGNRLNNDYGRMGAEQHLPRFPGDNAQQHGEFVDKGITPGLGGWGYVSDFDVEKYYVAVQTMYISDWSTRTKYYVDWFKWRHMVAVNPANGKAMVVAVADAGPANWTGKHFGGSPEVMNYLGIDYGQQNHPVILFFLDDPKNEVPLGPLEYNVEANKKLLANQT